MYGLAVDGKGNLYISDGYSRVRKVSRDGTITTFAGGGQSGGDGVPATSAELSIPTGVAVDGRGNVYIAEYNPNRVRKVSPNGTITTFAGRHGRLRRRRPRNLGAVSQPLGVAADAQGNVYIAPDGIRKVDPKGTITTITSCVRRLPRRRRPGHGRQPGRGVGRGRSRKARTSTSPTSSTRACARSRPRRRPRAASTTATTAAARTLETVLTQMANGRATLQDTLGRAPAARCRRTPRQLRVAAVALSRQPASPCSPS